MTDRTIDITDRPEEWREGDKATGLNDGHNFSGEIWQHHSGAWYAAGSNVILQSTGSYSGVITQLRVTRTIPALPEEEGVAVRWSDHDGILQLAERFEGTWFRPGSTARYTDEDLIGLIDDAEVFVAKWRPLDAGAGS